ncbi:MAG TPA: YceI family protein [Actinoplanes sp.]|jgi:polyisoprenoid-binding protein YceI
MTAAPLTIDALDLRVPVGTWTIDPAHSSIGFSVRHLMGKVRGTFEEFTGHVTTAEAPTDCSATATIAMSSVNTANRMRDDDLRSANFFDVVQYPDLTFESTGLAVNGGLLVLPGKLTIRSITRDVAMEVEFLGLDETGLQGEQRIGISATTTIRRSDYGVGASAGEGQKIVVGDKITIQLDIQAMLES